MTTDPLPTPRKRGRPPLHRPKESPLSNVVQQSAVKRRKLNAYETAASTPKAIKALRTAFGGVFGLGNRVQDVQVEDARLVDELGVDVLVEHNPSDVENTPLHNEAEQLTRSTQKDRINATPISKTKAASIAPMAQEKQRQEHLQRNDEDASEAIEANSDGAVNDQAINNASPLLRSIDARTSQSPAVDDGGIVRSSGRARKRPRRYSDELLEAMNLESKTARKVSTSGGMKAKRTTEFQVGNPARDELDLGFEDVTTVRRKTPTSSKAGKRSHHMPRSRKSMDSSKQQAVLNEQNDTETNLDQAAVLSKSLKSAKMSRSAAVSEEPADVDDSEEDDTMCAICAGGESEPPNEIILCDNCDLAVHQICYEIPVIPEGDWICRDCRPDEDDEQIVVDAITLSQPIIHINDSCGTAPDIEQLEYHLQITQRLLLEKLTGRRRLKAKGLEEEYLKVHQVVEQTVLAGEGNSMLIIGARGCGKTTLVESVIEEISQSNKESFHVIRLNGFIHTDDKVALREIWRQLGRELEVEDDLTAKTNNYADTLASLLALLSHPSEISDMNSDQTAKSVIFLLDEFDLFTYHARQTLLYNLFDIAQARKAPIAVLGMTTKIDVVEHLEKRVKSRFSHRYVHLAQPKSLVAYWNLCKEGLMLDMDEIVEQGFDPGFKGQEEFLSYWNAMIEDLYREDPLFIRHVQTHYHRSKSVTAFFTSCVLPIANLTPNSLPLKSNSFITEMSLLPPDSKLHLLRSLSDLDLAMLIAAARLDIILDTDTCNFAMAYDEYSTLTSRHKIQTSSTGVAALGAGTKVWGRDVAIGAWERLIDYDLLLPAVLAGGSGGRDVGKEGKMWKVDVGLEEIPGSVDGLSTIMTKWCREI